MATEAIAPVGRSAATPTPHEVTVAFVDIVGFTQICEELPVEHVGDLVEWLERAALEVARPPVTLVKMVGDAAMLAGPDPVGVMFAVRAMLHASAADADAPRLHAGIASGRALHRTGDWLGGPVNLANHLAAIAGPGVALATAAVAQSVPVTWTEAGPASVPGLDRLVELYRLEP